MKDTYDPFRPRAQPAQAIYDAFQAEAAKRGSRSVDAWVIAERRAVWSAAKDAAQQLGIEPPSMAEVEEAERFAIGHIDYGSKWALWVAQKMGREQEKVRVA